MQSPKTPKALRPKARFQRAHPKQGKAANWLVLFGLVCVAGTATGMYYVSIPGKTDLPQLTHTVERGDLIVSVVEQGTLESSENTEIKCRIRGWSKITSIVESGSTVKEGDELVRIDTKRIEDAISLHTTDAHTARATLERTKADVKQAEMAENAYLNGRYLTENKNLHRGLKIAESNLETSRKMLARSKSMFNQGYISDLEVEGNEFTVTQAELELEVAQTRLEVLEKYTKAMELETIRGRVLSSNSKLKADLAGLAMDEGRRDRAIAELKLCVIRAPKYGMVIYPSAAAWKDTPDVTEGANVRKDQVLLLMPNLEKMQVKVGIHESMVDRINVGQRAIISLAEGELEGEVVEVAAVARPAGWWTGNVVKYDTVVSIPPRDDLKPGMSAGVEVVLAEHKDQILLPVAAVVETDDHALCWVKKEDSVKRCEIELGDSNDIFVIATSGVEEGDEVVLNPVAFIEEAQNQALEPVSRNESESLRNTSG
ncbi:MAG: efflux RND transporter periplasmic adaptor subunit [Pirellulaceae bacterium]